MTEPVLTSQGKQDVLADYFDRYPRSRVVETGLWNGNGSCTQFVGRDGVIVYGIEARRDYAELAQANHPGLRVRLGDSAESLPRLLQVLGGPALFWLDAHTVEEAGEENTSPLMAELAAIIAWPHAAESVVLIDDLRMMGRDGWPSVEQLREVVDGTWERSEAEDIMRLVPR